MQIYGRSSIEIFVYYLGLYIEEESFVKTLRDFEQSYMQLQVYWTDVDCINDNCNYCNKHLYNKLLIQRLGELKYIYSLLCRRNAYIV